MCIKDRRCLAWISLESLGIHAQGCMRDPSWINDIIIPCNQSIFNQAAYIDLPNEKLTCLKNVSHGKFGFIDLAVYDNKHRHADVYVKRPILSGRNLLYEACIQKLVADSLLGIGFPTGAPQPISIFRLRDNSICFAMEQIEGAITLDKYLEKLTVDKFISVVIDCLIQLSAMIWHLNNNLGMNHRDLKPSNFLIVEHSSPITKILQIENDILEIESRYSLTFIDFGFSCLGSTETQISDISLSTVYSKSDPCPKEGRDMYLFLAFLYIDFYTRLPIKLIDLFESWLHIPGSNLFTFIQKDKDNAKKWLYFIAGNNKIFKFNSCPIKIIKDLQNLVTY